ncbi:hypothetical protein QOT17_018784 [Balamuthia mandrillaris]
MQGKLPSPSSSPPPSPTLSLLLLILQRLPTHLLLFLCLLLKPPTLLLLPSKSLQQPLPQQTQLPPCQLFLRDSPDALQGGKDDSKNTFPLQKNLVYKALSFLAIAIISWQLLPISPLLTQGKISGIVKIPVETFTYL